MGGGNQRDCELPPYASLSAADTHRSALIHRWRGVDAEHLRVWSAGHERLKEPAAPATEEQNSWC
ncbi:MAG: hypothetical protein VYD19_01215 [Myxococcota bacterium]|nr:hypothetical protein [Myxococcota bacterium]